MEETLQPCIVSTIDYQLLEQFGPVASLMLPWVFVARGHVSNRQRAVLFS